MISSSTAWFTSSLTTYIIKNRYRDLLRVSREWRDLHNRMRAGQAHDRMRAGQAHDRTTDFVPGALATFCPACPQLGINIPPEREWKHDESFVKYSLQLTGH
jgi:hypothetical protein